MGSSKITTKDLSEPVVEALNTIDTVADQITTVDTNVNSIKSTVEGNSNKLDTINTNATNINTRLTDTRAANLDLLSNSTYGLSALKTAIGKIPTSSSGGGSYAMGNLIAWKEGQNYTTTKPVFVCLGEYARIGSVGISGVSGFVLVGAGVTITCSDSDFGEYGIYEAIKV